MKTNTFFIFIGGFLLSIFLFSCAKERLPDHAGPITLKKTIPHKTKNLIIVTLDGFRWQEVFKGADSTLLFNHHAPHDFESLKDKFWNQDNNKRRRTLLPFFWSSLKNNGRIYGNRKFNNKVNVANPYWLSYPGYNEILTGWVNFSINNNKYGKSPDYNILEFLSQQDGFRKNDVAVFTNWPAFSRIINTTAGQVNVYAGARKNNGAVTTYYMDSVNINLRENIHSLLPYKSGKQLLYDERTYASGKEYLIKHHPKVLYISFSGTDKYGHVKKYNQYLKAAHNSDFMLQDLWNYLQNTPQYKNKTTLIVTTDHGRGEGKEWYHHSSRVSHSDQTWFAAIGPDTSPQGEMKNEAQFYNKQWAKTFARFLGFKVKGVKFMADPIDDIFRK